ncbi:gamma-aminobutyric acid receptor subunit beta-like [Tigriopus californicus]|uniref:gamma-aminobutyric acid receptor subunit beta-like n=1 Tax=Tigriopus californicus TaxID=6832 RepID=UPI0027DA94C3|nr:gamma-aminobutyric acid receptor subunit beta-like [Tigriopus californicus]
MKAHFSPTFLVLLGLLSLGLSERIKVSETLDRLLADYDPRVRPNYQVEPLTVNVSLYVLDMPKISSRDKEYTLMMFFRQFWKDERLAYADGSLQENIVASSGYSEKIWVPDTFFVNERKATFHHIPSPNEFIRIEPDGRILRSVRISVTLTCNMDMSGFPFDSQTCSMEMESYGAQMKDIKYDWQALDISSHIHSEDFAIIGFKNVTEEAHLSTGSYSRLVMKIFFERKSGYYVTVFMIPVAMLTILAMMSMWMDRDNIIARLGLILVGIMGVMCSSTIVQVLHPASETKAIDVYFGISVTMIFFVALEAVIVTKKGGKTQSGSYIESIARLAMITAFVLFQVVIFIYAMVLKMGYPDGSEDMVLFVPNK